MSNAMPWELSIHAGSVAHFVQKVLKGQLPLPVRGLGGQGVELCGRGAALLDAVFQLPFAQPVHQFKANKGGLRRLKRFASEHRPTVSLDVISLVASSNSRKPMKPSNHRGIPVAFS